MIDQMGSFIIGNICSYLFVFPELLFCPECQYYLIASLIDHRSIKSIVYDIKYDFVSYSHLPKGYRYSLPPGASFPLLNLMCPMDKCYRSNNLT